MKQLAEVIDLNTKGIDLVASKFAERYRPYQERLDTAWGHWQFMVRQLGVPHRNTGERDYHLPDTIISTEALTHHSGIVRTAARLSIAGRLDRIPEAQRSMRWMQRFRKQGVLPLPYTADKLWEPIETHTIGYTINIQPLRPDTRGTEEYITRPPTPTHEQWVEKIEEIGAAVFRLYEIGAEEREKDINWLQKLLQPDQPGPGDGWYASGGGFGTEAGIAL